MTISLANRRTKYLIQFWLKAKNNSIGIRYKALTITGRRVKDLDVIVRISYWNIFSIGRIYTGFWMIVTYGSFWATTCFFTHHQHLNTRLVSSLNSGLKKKNNLDFVKVSQSSLVLRIWDVALSVLGIVSVSVMGTWHTLKRFSLTLPKVTINLLSDQKQEPSFYRTIHLTETSSQL